MVQWIAMYEARHQPLLSRARFLRRLFGHTAVVIGLIGASLVLGETLGVIQYLGGAMVIGAIVANVLIDQRRRRAMKAAPEPA